MYRAVPVQVDLPALDHDVLRFWRENDVFAGTLEQSRGRPEWVFYEGPPTANGMPGATISRHAYSRTSFPGTGP
jgi:isoleucyl-tRNA synthetase